MNTQPNSLLRLILRSRTKTKALWYTWEILRFSVGFAIVLGLFQWLHSTDGSGALKVTFDLLLISGFLGAFLIMPPRSLKSPETRESRIPDAILGYEASERVKGR